MVSNDYFNSVTDICFWTSVVDYWVKIIYDYTVSSIEHEQFLNRVLTDTTTQGYSGLGNNGNEGALNNTKHSLVSFPRHPFCGYDFNLLWGIFQILQIEYVNI